MPATRITNYILALIHLIFISWISYIYAADPSANAHGNILTGSSLLLVTWFILAVLLCFLSFKKPRGLYITLLIISLFLNAIIFFIYAGSQIS